MVAVMPLFGEETAQLIPQYAQHSFPQEWYKKQLQLWRGIVKRDPKNAIAWYQIFKAQRYSFFGDAETSMKERVAAMKSLLEEMGAAVPESVEYNLAMWRNGGNDKNLYQYLEKAFQLQPNHPEIPEEMVAFQELMGDKNKRDFFVKKMYDEKHYIAPALLEYGYNVLMSLEKNAIVFVAGDNDTYPLWMVQVVKGIRPDVVVLNTSLFMEPEYHKSIVEKYHLKADESLLSEENRAKKEETEVLSAYIRTLTAQYTERPLYFALTVHDEITDPIKDNLYLTGLVQKYSAKRFDNIAVLKNNWEKFRLDYLSLEFYAEENNTNATWLPLFNLNYVAPIAVLYEHYIQSGDKNQAEDLKALAMDLAQKGKQQQEVKEYFAGIDNNNKTLLSTEEQPQYNELSFVLKPNPAENSVVLGLPSGLQSRVVITDMRGGIVKEIQNVSGEFTVQVSDLTNGNYTVQFFTEFGAFSKTLVIAR